MSCQLGKNIHHLRKKNRDLLEQLESNSLLLEDRIKKLTHTARTPRRSDKSWQELPPSPLKRRYESWRARNSSEHVAAALNANLFCPPLNETSSSDSNVNDEARSKTTRKPPAKSPAKRSKRNVVIVSGTKKKHSRQRQCLTSKSTAPKPRLIKKQKKPCADCYCPDYYIERTSSSDTSLQEAGNIDSGESHCLEYVRSQVQKPILGQQDLPSVTRGPDFNHQGKHGEEASSFPNYSPKSVFLRRLKKSSQVEGGLNIPVCHPTTAAKSTSTKEMEGDDSDVHETSNEDDAENRAPDLASVKDHTAGANRCLCRQRVPAPLKQTQTRTGSSKSDNNPKCHCSERKDGSSTCCKRSSVTDNCRCHCCRQQMIGGYDIIAGLVDNENEHRRVREHPSELAWFDEMNRFRRSHWFDCHAHRSASCTNRDGNLQASWVDSDHDSRKHKCVHRFVLNDRLFPEPAYGDHLDNSRCQVCHLPCGLAGRGCKEPRHPREITLPSKPPPKEVLVTLPTANFPRDANTKVYPPSNIMVRDVPPVEPSATSLQSSRRRSAGLKPPTASSRSLRHRPVPANSLALRYQKGVA